MTRLVFVTSGVASSLGKGVTAAALGAVLAARGLRVTLVKLAPYLNVDSRALRPHGEVFLTDDGAETDRDLGHAERFLGIPAAGQQSVTLGQVYAEVIRRERRGDYLGRTVQVIPHLTDEIQRRILAGAAGADLALVVVGGTVGDIESLPFLEAIRQRRVTAGPRHTLFAHLTLVPFLRAAGEIKTKPAQHTVHELRAIGIQPDLLLCRAELPLPDGARRKLALFTNVPAPAVLSVVDTDTVYRLPHLLQAVGADAQVLAAFGLDAPPADLTAWEPLLAPPTPTGPMVTLGVVSAHPEQVGPAAPSLDAALQHSARLLGLQLDRRWLGVDPPVAGCDLSAVDALLVPDGAPPPPVALAAIHAARTLGVPFLGLGAGMHWAVSEFARQVAGLAAVERQPGTPDTPEPVIIPLAAADQPRGGRVTRLAPGSLARAAYGRHQVRERHRQTAGLNPRYQTLLMDHGLRFTGAALDGRQVDIIELPGHPWFLGCQFLPEFTAAPWSGHPLFLAFLRAARTRHANRTRAPSLALTPHSPDWREKPPALAVGREAPRPSGRKAGAGVEAPVSL